MEMAHFGEGALQPPDAPHQQRRELRLQRRECRLRADDPGAAEDDGLPDRRGADLLAAADRVAARRAAGGVRHRAADAVAAQGQPPGDGGDGLALHAAGRNADEHSNGQGVRHGAARAAAVSPERQRATFAGRCGSLFQRHGPGQRRVHGHGDHLPGDRRRGVPGDQPADDAVRHSRSWTSR